MSNDNKYILNHAHNRLAFYIEMKTELFNLEDGTKEWLDTQIDTWTERCAATDPDSSIKPKWWRELGMDYKKEHGYSV